MLALQELLKVETKNVENKKQIQKQTFFVILRHVKVSAEMEGVKETQTFRIKSKSGVINSSRGWPLVNVIVSKQKNVNKTSCTSSTISVQTAFLKSASSRIASIEMEQHEAIAFNE